MHLAVLLHYPDSIKSCLKNYDGKINYQIFKHKEAFENTYSLLKPGGNYVIIDVYADIFVPQSWLVKLVAKADLKRKSWEFLEKNTTGFSLINISKNRYLHGGLLYIASGKKISE